MRTVITVCIATILFFTPAAFAEEAASPPAETGWTTLAAADEAAATEESALDVAEDPETLEPVVVTATSIAMPVSRIGSSVTVITREQLEQLGSH
ncbi:MAG: hypothetical protein ACYS8W_21890, partial [Planctomycetota bacterium]